MNIYRSLIIFSIFLTSCVANDPYPSDWEPLLPQTTNDCGAIEGIYNNYNMEGITLNNNKEKTYHDYNKAELSFAKLISPYHEDYNELSDIEGPYVRFTLLNSNELEIAILNTNKEVMVAKTLNAEKGDFSCEDGHLVFDPGGNFELSDIAVGYATSSSTVYPTDDYLVVKIKSSGAAMIGVFIPFAGTSTHWYRIRRLPL